MTDGNIKHKKLAEKLEQLQNAFQSSSDIKFTLSDELLKSEEERLHLSKMLVETEIKCNSMQQQLEIQKFDSANRVTCLDNTVSELEEEIQSLKTILFQEKERRKTAEDRFNVINQDLELTQENLKTSNEKYNKLVTKKDELHNQLVSLIKSKASKVDHFNTIDTLRRSIEDLQKDVENPPNLNGRIPRENGVGCPQLSEYDQLRIEQECYSNRCRFRDELDRVRSNYETQQCKMKKEIKKMRSQLCDSKVETKEKQEKICELSSKFIIQRHKLQNLETEYNSVQNRSRTWVDRFRATLDKWMNHIADFLDDISNADESIMTEKMSEYLHQMLEDMRNAHNLREQQLCEAVQTTRENISQLSDKHQKLIASYKSLKLQVRHIETIDIGPDTVEEEYILSENKGDLKNIKKMNDELTLTNLELENMRLKEKLSKNSNKKQKTQTVEDTFARQKDENRQLEQYIAKLELFINKNLTKYKLEIEHMKYHVGDSLLKDKLLN